MNICKYAARLIVLAAISMILDVSVAGAETPYRYEAFGSVGGAQVINFFGPSYGGVSYGGGFGFRPFPVNRPRVLRMLGGEFEASAVRISRNSVTTTQGFFTGNVLFHGSLGNVEPYLLVGGGLSHRGDTHRVGNAGFGVKIFVNRLSIRPEFRVMVSEYLGSFARESISVGYHW